MKENYTVFCQDAEGGGTIWISSLEADSVEDAANEGRAQCAEDWEQEIETIHVLGIAAGDVEILEWSDLDA